MMKYSKEYKITYKFRTTMTQAEAINSYAQINNYTVSEAIRELLFDESTDLVVLIHKELVKQQVYNLLENTQMPKQTRKKLIEEVSKID